MPFAILVDPAAGVKSVASGVATLVTLKYPSRFTFVIVTSITEDIHIRFGDASVIATVDDLVVVKGSMVPIQKGESTHASVLTLSGVSDVHLTSVSFSKAPGQ